MIWRQQHDEDDFPLIRSTLVGFSNYMFTPNDRPPEQHDMSVFCTSEHHIAKVGAFLLNKRVLCNRTATVQLVPNSHSGRIFEGDIVQIKIKINASDNSSMILNDWWEVISVGDNDTLELSLFPVDDNGRSLLAIAVEAAQPSGLLLEPPQPALCDVPGRGDDLTIPPPINGPPPPPNGAIPIPGGPGDSNGMISLPPRGDTAKPPPSTPQPPATPGGEPLPPNVPPNPPPGHEGICTEGFGVISTRVESAIANASQGWGPNVDLIRTKSGIAVKPRKDPFGVEYNWIFDISYVGENGQTVEYVVFSSEDGTGATKAGNGQINLTIINESGECKNPDGTLSGTPVILNLQTYPRILNP
jgi:hypothetical protein